MRGAPQEGFSLHILRISARTSGEMTGRPGLPQRTFQVQNRRNPARCQAMTVSGLTMVSAERQATPEARQTDPQQAVSRGQFQAFCSSSPKHTDLVTQSQVLELEGGTRSEDRRQSREECQKSSEHRRNYERCNSHPFRSFEVFEKHSRRRPRKSARCHQHAFHRWKHRQTHRESVKLSRTEDRKRTYAETREL
jgi:hypothetical protein